MEAYKRPIYTLYEGLLKSSSIYVLALIGLPILLYLPEALDSNITFLLLSSIDTQLEWLFVLLLNVALYPVLIMYSDGLTTE